MIDFSLSISNVLFACVFNTKESKKRRSRRKKKHNHINKISTRIGKFYSSYYNI